MRSGSFSSAEPRSSTKGVLTGAGRASRCRIQALSTAPGCAADGSAIAASRTAVQPAVPRLARRCPARLRILLASALPTVAPEVIEIEPVERCIAHVMLQPPRVTADERRDRGRALAPRDRQPVAEVLEHQIVAV